MVSGWIETHIQRAWDRLNGLDDAVLMGRVLVNHGECAGYRLKPHRIRRHRHRTWEPFATIFPNLISDRHHISATAEQPPV